MYAPVFLNYLLFSATTLSLYINGTSLGVEAYSEYVEPPDWVSTLYKSTLAVKWYTCIVIILCHYSLSVYNSILYFNRWPCMYMHYHLQKITLKMYICIGI